MWEYNYTDELYHHGVKNQRWGVRRYQNKDGSLTPAGKKRYANNTTSSSEKFTASNGMKVAPAKNTYVKVMRKVSSARPVEAYTRATYRSRMSKKHADTVTNRLETAKGERQIHREARAIREYNAHQKDLRKGTGNKYLNKEIRKNKIDDAYEKIQSDSTRVDRFLYSDSTRKRAAKYVVDNNMPYKDAVKKSQRNAIAETAATLAIYGAYKIGKASYQKSHAN